MKFRYLFFSVLLIFTLSLNLAACSPSAQPTTDSQTQDPAASGEMLTITDTGGNTISLQQPPQRIIVAGKATPYVLDTLFLFPQAGDRLTALELRNFDTQEFLKIVDPDVDVKDMLDTDAGPEQIAPYQPDLVIVKNISVAKLGSSLQAIDIPVIGLNLETPEAFYDDIRVLGEVFDAEDRASEIVSFYQERVQKVNEIVSTASNGEKPSVLVIQVSEEGGETGFTVPPQGYLQTKLVQMAGGNPVWLEDTAESSGWILVGLEQIAAWNPDMIFVVNYRSDSNETAESLLENPQWQGLAAVENQRIYGFPADYASWDLIDPRWILGLEWLTTKINPDLADSINMEEQVYDFYRVLYRLGDEQIEAQILPRLDELNQ